MTGRILRPEAVAEDPDLKENRGRVIGGVETITDIAEIIEKDTQIEAYHKELFSDEHFHGIIGDSEAIRMRCAKRQNNP
ncbi:hypothetical protein QUF75_02480 [Desulfococcaceae bacterium HSG7]|nr:hypothetical protein [Desulfococcaceae bacterium HSG9]MDM8553579.1 hypothetical protein [Desulfococcaceae bacterium HSG7]